MPWIAPQLKGRLQNRLRGFCKRPDFRTLPGGLGPGGYFAGAGGTGMPPA